MAVPAGLNVGQSIMVAIRPESIELAAAESAAPKHAIAKVVERTFLGNITEYTVELEGGLVLRAQSHPRDKFVAGENVSVWIDTGQCSVVSAD